jgi:tetrahydromethanopterin S-methyltransferase subunit B
MPSFKVKPQKKIKFDKKTAVTIDSKHREIVNDLDKDINERIPDIKSEIYELNNKLKKSTSFEQKLDFEEAISEKKKTIHVYTLHTHFVVFR